MSHSSVYDAEHDRRRAELLPFAYNTRCRKCGLVMLRGQQLDLGHGTPAVLDPGARGDAIEHASCNRGDGARLGQLLRKGRAGL